MSRQEKTNRKQENVETKIYQGDTKNSSSQTESTAEHDTIIVTSLVTTRFRNLQLLQWNFSGTYLPPHGPLLLLFHGHQGNSFYNGVYFQWYSVSASTFNMAQRFSMLGFGFHSAILAPHLVASLPNPYINLYNSEFWGILFL